MHTLPDLLYIFTLRWESIFAKPLFKKPWEQVCGEPRCIGVQHWLANNIYVEVTWNVKQDVAVVRRVSK